MSFWCLKFSKKPTKNLTNFCPESKKWSNHEIKAHYIDLNTNYVQIILNIMRRCFYFVVLITFDILGQKLVKFFVGFLENLKTSKRHSEIIWPLKNLSLQQKEDTSTSDTKCSQKELIEKSGVVIKGPIDFVSDIQLDEEKGGFQ